MSGQVHDQGRTGRTQEETEISNKISCFQQISSDQFYHRLLIRKGSPAKPETSGEEGHGEYDDLSNEQEREGVAGAVQVHGGVVVEAEGRLLLASVPPSSATKELRILAFIG